MSWKKKANSNREALFGATGSSSAPSVSTAGSTSSSAGGSKKHTTNRGYTGQSGGIGSRLVSTTISPEVRAAKIKEAEDYRDRANKCMERGFFKSADPVAASTLFKRAADAYQQAGEIRLECLYRLESAKCNMAVGAWASAAGDYTRAAQLAIEHQEKQHDPSDESYATARHDACDYHKKAAEAWANMNEKGKAAESQIRAALVLMSGEQLINRAALQGLEEAVEAHVPDVMNPYARYRQTGRSMFLEPDETLENPSPEALQLAQSHLVTKAYAHEPLLQVTYMLVKQGEYPSALYAAGAATRVLEQDGLSTLSLSRAYCTETILLLAMGDPVAAEERFLNAHVQKTFYLSSRECKLSEDLFRAIKTRDAEALEEARSPTGSNRAALANLDESLRVLVTELRLTGVARKVMPGDKDTGRASRNVDTTNKTKSSASNVQPETPLNELVQKKTGYENDYVTEDAAVLDGDVLENELEALNFDGGGDDDDNDSLDSMDDLR